jgi:hypothetical protein
VEKEATGWSRQLSPSVPLSLSLSLARSLCPSPGCMIPLDMGLPSYVLYGPSTLASSMEASRDAKYMVSKMSGEKEMEGCIREEFRVSACSLNAT